MTNSETIYDLLIIGGGINGCGIARDASGRGLSVYLCEQFDLANETSSRSTKLIHGGLRYLEYYEFRLVREALAERDVLLNIAPHIIQPQEFIIPHNQLQRPACRGASQGESTLRHTLRIHNASVHHELSLLPI